MVWPFHRRRAKPTPEADAAIRRAEVALADAKKDGPEVTRLAEFLRHRRQQNHFGEGLMSIIRGGDQR